MNDSIASPRDIKDALVLASTGQLIEELLARATIGVVCVGGTPSHPSGGVIGFKAPDKGKLHALLDALSDSAEEITG